ncbi:hypothetical protein OHU11_35965 [Streptomyces sp. NBC_00257]|uniref:hypothetical protein n=1 Tax=unclassified Streptomyces TaxID=2593676 RepID=UPI00225A3E9E|nr:MULTISPECIES: hypothetical protein [unclassified Streptomyces]WTB53059.1 hypothetical protein OG832_07720 [Streptomyces sp. NBC_00826]WTH94049.1 hypothetical protein OIC43_35970 [Streptomyces sp. NBC_00825]WTI02784.1 hypothetical protein OHA23_35950 [Streptomyces sp. NBC_00822]MCX4868434.1 hypothetical protein [Streptomyces sp. NBC_00906]MCX4899672.1 hypothetical protein [Streptomyces sp. NBC_00892]
MTTSRNEETAAASEPEAHATAEAAAGETPARTARAASAKGSGTSAAAEPSTAPEEEAEETSEKCAETSAGAPTGTSTGTRGEASGEKKKTASTGAAAESGRKSEPEQEQEQEQKSEAEATGAAATTESEGAAATATATAEADAEAEATATMTATTTADAPEKTGRPNKALLAGAAIAGVLLVTVPFLVHTGGGNDGKRSAGSGEAPGTMLGAGNGDVPGAFASAAPSPRAGSGKQPPAGKDGKGGSGPSADGAGVSKPLNEGGGSTGGDTGGTGGGSGGGKSTGGEKSTARKPTTGSGGSGSGSGSTAGGTAQKSAPQSTVVYSGVTGHGCPTPSGGGFQQDHYFTDGSAGWYTRSSGGWTGNGCNGSYSSIPMSGDTSTDMQNRVKWWWKPGTRARTCQISVFIPNSNTNLYVGGHPTKYHVLVNANDRTTMYSSFSINQVAHRGQWVDAGTFAMKGATIGVKLLDRGDDWSKGWEKAHHAAAQMRATCRS